MAKSSAEKSAPKQQRIVRTPEHVGGRVMLSIREAARRVGIHEASIYRLLATNPSFPRPVKVTERRRAFFEDEVDQYLESRPRF